MAKRVSHSLIDPYLIPLVPGIYRVLPIPRRFPPEGIIAIGHLLAIAGAFGFAISVEVGWGGLLISAGVAGNHLADMVDGTHARSTGQCRNGGELLDHFTDPLSFSYWMIGWGVSIESLPLALPAVLVIYASAVLTSIKAKLIGSFTLARFGPTEMKVIFIFYGFAIAMVTAGWLPPLRSFDIARGFFWIMLAIGVSQLAWNLVRSIGAVNRHGSSPNTTAWELRSKK